MGIIAPISDVLTSTTKYIGTDYNEEEVAFLRVVVKECQAKKRTNLSNVELFRLMLSMGYKKDKVK